MGYSVELAAQTFGMKVETLKTWIRRHGLLDHLSNGRGHAMLLADQDMVAVYIVSRLVPCGFTVGLACKIANSAAKYPSLLSSPVWTASFDSKCWPNEPDVSLGGVSVSLAIQPAIDLVVALSENEGGSPSETVRED
ncbi:MAG: hypothetical protein CML50_00730 [Rhodobacteraceae bacterium]|uniref:MerR HTH family regulatory protein n=1 Tax=Salipiger profundus TaxID=1229727 RepID=A0A1U7D0V0_9RHOB|nr:MULTISPECIES: hypothetical protein [Salipiger]APX21710.1 hypothetical protein Ga0080559_TMP914 [Salipiger profundus]MAB04531.1 hypothetical protein [Paracoccaceae bacterium]GGA00517.1 hypothetical protein GCM10011326_09420 [Salipiger profundus]